MLTELERLAALVSHMRHAQKLYFRVRTDKALREAKDAEGKVDAYLEALSRGPDLFDPEGRP